ncbi:kinetochore protein Nuf2 [Eucyclogobius newberryi]|uniref:kinetochore protein Nuf2 n=1 Tax=Eucyclogobius newberryi TaxID=166745 RepID=UPI003B5AAF60
MSENTFPVYSVDVLVNFYRTEVLTGQESKHLNKSDLTPTPKPEAVQMLYMRVLHFLFRFRPECHSMLPLLDDMQYPQYPQYHEGPTSILSVYIRMRHFLPSCLYFDFSMNDLLAPKKQRTLTILSGIMNFLHFKIQKIKVVLDKQAKFRADMDRLLTYVKFNKEGERKIEILTTIPPEQQAEADELAAALSELQATTLHEYQEANIKKDSIAEWKTKNAEKTQKLAQIKVEVTNLKDDINKLKSQIVESPEELKSQMEKMRDNVKNIKMSIEKADEYVVELQSMLQAVGLTEAETQQTYGLLLELENRINDIKQLQEENQELTSEKKLKELKNLCLEESQLKRVVGMKQDKDSKQNIRRQMQRERKELHTQEVLGQYNQIHQKREEMANKIKEITNETQHLKAKIQNLRDVCSKETMKAQALFDTLSASMDNLHRQMDMTVAEFNQDHTRMSANVFRVV